jgi:hypothetical protein
MDVKYKTIFELNVVVGMMKMVKEGFLALIPFIKLITSFFRNFEMLRIKDGILN